MQSSCNMNCPKGLFEITLFHFSSVHFCTRRYCQKCDDSVFQGFAIFSPRSICSHQYKVSEYVHIHILRMSSYQYIASTACMYLHSTCMVQRLVCARTCTSHVLWDGFTMPKFLEYKHFPLKLFYSKNILWFLPILN